MKFLIILLIAAYVSADSLENTIKALGEAGGSRVDYGRSKNNEDLTDYIDSHITKDVQHNRKEKSAKTANEKEDMHIVLGKDMAVATNYGHPYPMYTGYPGYMGYPYPGIGVYGGAYPGYAPPPQQENKNNAELSYPNYMPTNQDSQHYPFYPPQNNADIYNTGYKPFQYPVGNGNPNANSNMPNVDLNLVKAAEDDSLPNTVYSADPVM